MVKVRLFAMLYELTNKKELEVENANTVREIIEKLDSMYPGFKGFLEKGYLILVNGINIVHLNDLDTKVNDTDVVSIFPKVGGG
ncbi:MoaD/ThiS family protein [Fervidicoccus fontis]|uniref:Molybdopterin converting factor, subunit 1 n=2 Tax=Fervidicoccus fontis TaxID=683846 RepID=H9ZZN1_FERFK|nr:MoaD/ThiS family protein [Fervidicoccus fontis]AFH42188.1 molybdopterin converting factor, subunit 1 [Fervidicoccus fontis Kam940]MBE9390940.1 MoaD/ThiS family protein [Fervidicoccus fontis]PMB76016.1 MAG: molybdopterin synthase sulfur carrier subunit [Fervidicoccus fontis]HEW64313.1 MoaD/ThiS family protein [Fervidicoccus fontis]